MRDAESRRRLSEKRGRQRTFVRGGDGSREDRLMQQEVGG